MSVLTCDGGSGQPWCMFPEPGSSSIKQPTPAAAAKAPAEAAAVTLAVDSNGGGYWYINSAQSGNAQQTFVLVAVNVSAAAESALPPTSSYVLVRNVGSGKCMAPDPSWLTFPSSPFFAGMPLLSAVCPGNAGGVAELDPALWLLDGSTGQLRHAASALCLDADSLWDCSHPELSSLPYCDVSLPARQRAADLVPRLQAVEKVNFLVSNSVWGKINRFGLPELGYSECLHGVQNYGIPQEGPPSTNFPTPLALSRAWSADLVTQVGRAVSDELRGRSNGESRAADRGGLGGVSRFGRTGQGGGLICWAPVINICRDPRWGRCQESWGEDPLLTAQLANAFIRALQDGPDPRYKQVVATAKHFMVHSGPDSNPADRASFDVAVRQRDLLDSYGVAFKSAALTANVSGVMCGYSAVNGIPLCAHRGLLDLARDGWGWDGYVVSDCGAVGQISSRHHFTNDGDEAALIALASGVDWECPDAGSGSQYQRLLLLIQQGRLPEGDVDAAVRRMLTLMIELGLLEHDLSRVAYNDGAYYDVARLEVEHRRLAQSASAQSIVLLENKAAALPIKARPGLRIGVFGPCADNYCCQRATYDAKPFTATTYAAGLVNASRDAGHPLFGISVVTSAACTVPPDWVWPDICCSTNTSFPTALAAAAKVDVIIAAVGVNMLLEHESGDRLDLSLPGQQEALLTALYAASRADPQRPKPFIVALTSATQTISPMAAVFADAVVHVGYLGSQGGAGLADVLSGRVVPSSRLTEMWYKDAGSDLPPYTDYDYKQAPHGRGYRYSTAQPMYPFAYSLSYTQFAYGLLGPVAPAAIAVCDDVRVRVNVTNIGGVDAAHVVPLFVAPAGFVPPPSSPVDTTFRYRLAAFRRLDWLCAGCSTEVEFVLSAADRGVLAPERGYSAVVSAERWQVWVGGLPSTVSDADRTAWQTLYEQRVSSSSQVNATTALQLLQHPGWDRPCGGGVVRCLNFELTVTGPQTLVSSCAKARVAHDGPASSFAAVDS